MKKRIGLILLSLVLILGLMPSMAFAEKPSAKDYGTEGKDYVEGQAIVCLEGSSAALAKQKSIGEFQMETLMKIDGSSSEKTAARTAGNGAEDALVLVTSEQKSTADLIALLEQNPKVQYAEPNYIMKPYAVEPKDPAYVHQWGMKNQWNSKTDAAKQPAADANFVEAWEKAAEKADDSEKVVVAVLDSGVDYNHPDLKGIMWDDGLDIPALKAMGGGKYGYNVLPEQDWQGKPTGESSDDPMDSDAGHGTHCASVIASQWNDKGVAGTNGKNVEIMALRFLGNYGTIDGVLRAYAYLQTAAENGVNIAAVNNSWGPAKYSTLQLRSTTTAVQAVGEKYGIISCFAAGNDDTNNDLNTTSVTLSKYALNVGAMDSTGTAAQFSHYGKRTVDVFAPGAQILAATTTDTTYPQEKVQMPMQYLPQIMNEEDSWFYEDFEDGEDQVSLSLYDKDGKRIETARAVNGPGVASDRGLQISLDSIAEGENFSIEVEIPKSKIGKIGAKDAVYMAFQLGFDHAMRGEGIGVEYYAEETGKWECLNSISLDDENKNYPVGRMMWDSNWNQISDQIKEPEKILDTKEDTVRIRLVADEGMKGRVEGQIPVFRLDNFGLGKSASQYYYSDGTSMAAPMVTGLAGLLAAEGYDAEECIARIKGGVNRQDAKGLENKSVSGGFIDAGAAFDESKCVPVLDQMQTNGKSAVITGSFFGTAKGRLTIGGKTASVTKWDDSEIQFDLPEGLNGQQEVRIVRAGDNAKTDYGRNFFRLAGGSIGYTSLTAPDLSYGNAFPGELPVKSSDVMSYTMAAADGKIAYLGQIYETQEMKFTLYDIASDTWEQAELPKDFQYNGIVETYSLVGGKDKLYMAYMNTDRMQCIGTYDIEAKTWKTFDETSLYGLEQLVVYGDKLLAVGGEVVNEDEESEAMSAVQILDPDTGQTIGRLPDMPQARSGVTVVASGNKLYVAGGCDSIWNVYGGKPYKAFEDIMIFDGKQWTVSDEPFFGKNYPAFDKKQTLFCAVGAADNGLLAVGLVQNLGASDMRDTWFYDLEKGSWSAREDVRYSAIKTTWNAGVCYDGSLYVLSHTGLESEPLVFRELSGIPWTGPTDNPTGGDLPNAAVFTKDLSETEVGYTKGAKARALAVKVNAPDSGKLSYQWYVNTKKSISDSQAIAGATEPTYTPPTKTAGVRYYYCEVTNESESVSALKRSKFAKVAVLSDPAAPKIKAASGLTSVKISWNAVPGATGYQVYRASSKNGTYKRVMSTTARSWTNTNLTTGKAYYYKVRAYTKRSGAIAYGDFSGKFLSIPKPKAPDFRLTAQNNGVKVTWKKVSGADGYKVYRASSKNGKYSLIRTAKRTDQSYTNRNLKDKKTYYYKMRSYKNVNGKNVYSHYSTVKSVRTK